MGLFVGIAFALFSKQNQLGFLITTPVLGALFGLVWSQIGFRAATRGGTRDFASVSQVIATKYEVLVEHRLIEQRPPAGRCNTSDVAMTTQQSVPRRNIVVGVDGSPSSLDALGSVSAYCAAHASCPVLVTRAEPPMSASAGGLRGQALS